MTATVTEMSERASAAPLYYAVMTALGLVFLGSIAWMIGQLKDRGKREEHTPQLARGLLESSLVTLLVLGATHSLQEGQEDRARDAAKRDERQTRDLATAQFYLGLSQSADLTGFNPEAVKATDLVRDYKKLLKGRYLAGKTLDAASLVDMDLQQTVFRDSSLVGADLTNADLRQADLVAADLSYADLTGATLDGADLRAAVLTFTELPEEPSAMAGVVVDERTCWPTQMTASDIRRLDLDERETPDEFLEADTLDDDEDCNRLGT